MSAKAVAYPAQVKN